MCFKAPTYFPGKLGSRVEFNQSIILAPKRFLAVDICNLCPYDGGWWQAKKIMNETIIENKIVPDSDKYSTLLEYTDAANDQFKAEFESLGNAGKIDMRSQGFTLDQMLISCYFRGNRCYGTDFYFYHDYTYGSCFRFNGGLRDKAQNGGHTYYPSAIRKTSKPGWRNGLRLEMYTGENRISKCFIL